MEQSNAQKRYRKLELPNGMAEVWLERDGPRVTMRYVEPNGGGGENWTGCDVDGCLGEAVTPNCKCVCHADAASRTQYLSTLPGSGQQLSARGVEITPELFSALLASPHVTDSGTKVVKVRISLAGADIASPMDFDGITFDDHFLINGAIVR